MALRSANYLTSLSWFTDSADDHISHISLVANFVL